MSRSLHPPFYASLLGKSYRLMGCTTMCGLRPPCTPCSPLSLTFSLARCTLFCSHPLSLLWLYYNTYFYVCQYILRIFTYLIRLSFAPGGSPGAAVGLRTYDRTSALPGSQAGLTLGGKKQVRTERGSKKQHRPEEDTHAAAFTEMPQGSAVQ